MVRWMVVAAFVIALLITPYVLYKWPVGGSISRSDQVQAVALAGGGARRETRNRAAIAEALEAARTDWFRRTMAIFTDLRCRPQQMEFLTDRGWVAVEMQCRTGFMFDTIPPSEWVQKEAAP